MNKVIIYIALSMAGFASCDHRNNNQGKTINTVQADSILSVAPDTANFGVAPLSVEHIQHLYAATRSLIDQNRLDTASFEYNCHEEKKGRVTYYSQNGDLLLVTHQYNEYDHYEATDEYYLANDSLYFAFLKGTAWHFESGVPQATTDDVTERRVYMSKNHPIQCLEKKYSISSQSKDNPNPQTLDSQEVDCPEPMTILTAFNVLIERNGLPTAGCLE